MITYNLGDKFVIEIEKICRGEQDRVYPNMDNHLYKIKGFNSLVFDKSGLDKLQKYGTVRPSEWNEYLEEQYNKGLNAMWNTTKKLMTTMVADDYAEVFGKGWTFPKIMDMTPQEVIDAFEAYEKKQEEVEVGDVVEHLGTKGVVIDFIDSTDDEMIVLNENGCVEEWKHSQFIKTGKHIDISSILEQIGGGE